MSPAIWLALLAAAPIPRFERPGGLELSGTARPAAYLEASGRRAAFLGREDGSFEAWVYPMKVLHGFELAFEIESYAAPIGGAVLATSVTVRPESATVRYAHSSFTADATWLVPLEESGGLVLLDLDLSTSALDVIARFQPDVRLMWPAGLGGQYSYWDRDLRAYVLTESTRRHVALVGSPLALDPPEQPAHNLPDAPTEMRIAVTPELARAGLVPIVLAASDEGLDAARATYDRLLSETESLYRSTREHYRRLREETTRIETPDPALDRALDWGKVAFDKGFVCNPKLGCGLIAGLGPSGRSERPGFGWYFGGDAFINSWAMTAYGDFETVRESFRFLSKRQRADGKMMHELSQGAAYIPWFENYPYGYYHADTTPLYLAAVSDFVESSGDLDFAREIWPSIRLAYDYCLTTDEDGDGLMDNTKAGLGAVETGSLRSDTVLTDVYLAAAWTEATRAAARLARSLGESEFAAAAEAEHDKARGALNRRFLDDEEPGIAFAIWKSGIAQKEVTVWPAFGLWKGVFEEPRPAVAGALEALASSRLGTDWGARMLSRESTLYDPQSYNNGAVWPFLSGFAALALYENDRPAGGWFYVEGTKELTFLDSRGFVPELLSGDRLKPVDAAVPHQLFATAGLVSPLLRGLVGLRQGKIAPRPPASWDHLRVSNLRNRGSFDLEWSRARIGKETTETIRLEPHAGSETPNLPVELLLPAGAEPVSEARRLARARLSNGRSLITWSPGSSSEVRTLQLRYRGGIEVEPVYEPLAIGDRSRRLHVLDERLSGRSYVVRLEGRRGETYSLRVFTPYEIASIAPGTETSRDGASHWLQVEIPGGPASPANEEGWETVDLRIELAGR